MRKTIHRTLAFLLVCLLLISTASVGFAASVGQVKKLSLSARSSTQIKLTWKSVSKASGYQIQTYDAEKKQWEIAGTVKSTAFAHKVSPGTKYTYRVRAYLLKNGKTAYGKPSEKLSVLSDPEKVTKLTVAAATANAVKLKWAAAKGAAYYVIYQGSTENGSFKKLDTTTNKTFKVKFTAAPGTVWFKVRSVAKSGDLERMAAPSDGVKAKVVPEAVTAVTVVKSAGTYVSLKWTGGKGASGYYLFQKDASTAKEYVQVAKTTQKKYTVKFPAAPGKVYFKVQAFSKYKGQIIKTKVSPVVKLTIKPAKVKGLTLKDAGPTKLKLAWKAADGASAYELYQRNEKTLEYELLDTVKGTTYTVSGLQPSNTYRFAVKSVAAYKGNTLRSGFSAVLTAETILGTITGFDCTLDSGNHLFLSWNALKGAQGYQIEKSANGNDGWKMIADTKETVYEASAVESGKALSKGSKYFYRVRAYATEDGAKVYTDYTDVVEVHPIPDVPKITRTGTAAQHAICVEWTAVSGADGYDLAILDLKSGKWVSAFNEEALAAGVCKTYTNEKGVKTVYYTCKGLDRSGNYQFRVRSAAKNGAHYSYSEFSDTVSHAYTYVAEPQKYYSDATQKTGIVGYLYDPVEDCFCTAEDPWQRNFGFNKVYDIASQAVMIQYDTDPIQFTCHEGEEWMIQPWKGQYGMVLYGSEVGVYKKYTDRNAEHYDCAKDEDLLMMEMDLYKYNYDTKEWDHAFHRPYGSYWWITGFKFGYVRMVNPFEAQSFNTYRDLYIDARITLLDFDMLNAFKAALDKQIAKEKAAGMTRMSYTVGDAPKGETGGSLDIYLKFQ
ncbi:MAG: DUF4474 domain-containing protein [Clostridia bacterium]|nr:DUF4474 domain-containing protein [Clostridia bacterium]